MHNKLSFLFWAIQNWMKLSFSSLFLLRKWCQFKEPLQKRLRGHLLLDQVPK